MINLLPWRDARQQRIKQQFLRQLAVSLWVVGVIAVMIHQYVDSVLNLQQARNSDLQQQRQVLASGIAKAKQTKQIHQGLVTDINTINQINASRAYAVEWLMAINKIMPQGLYLTQVECKAGTITLVGVSLSNQQVNQLLDNILAAKWFAEPKLQSMTVSKKTYQFKRAFRISMLDRRFKVGEK